MKRYSNTCRIYRDINDSWKMCWYMDTGFPISDFRQITGGSKKELIETAKEMGFSHYFNEEEVERTVAL